MTQREIATIGFSPYNRVLETIDANVTFYENEVELIHGLNFRQIQNYAMPGILIVAAGIDKPTLPGSTDLPEGRKYQYARGCI